MSFPLWPRFTEKRGKRKTRKATVRRRALFQSLEARQLMAGDLRLDLGDEALSPFGVDLSTLQIAPGAPTLSIAATAEKAPTGELREGLPTLAADLITTPNVATLDELREGPLTSSVDLKDGVLVITAARDGTSVQVRSFWGYLIVTTSDNALKTPIVTTYKTSDVDMIVFHGSESRDEFVNATSKDCYAFGHGGNDRLAGGSGNDVLFGFAGDDTLVGGAGSDVLLGGTGNDALHGDDGDDWLVGHDGNDLLLGGAQNDWLLGGRGVNFALGGAGENMIAGPAETLLAKLNSELPIDELGLREALMADPFGSGVGAFGDLFLPSLVRDPRIFGHAFQAFTGLTPEMLMHQQGPFGGGFYNGVASLPGFDPVSAGIWGMFLTIPGNSLFGPNGGVLGFGFLPPGLGGGMGPGASIGAPGNPHWFGFFLPGMPEPNGPNGGIGPFNPGMFGFHMPGGLWNSLGLANAQAGFGSILSGVLIPGMGGGGLRLGTNGMLGGLGAHMPGGNPMPTALGNGLNLMTLIPGFNFDSGQRLVLKNGGPSALMGTDNARDTTSKIDGLILSTGGLVATFARFAGATTVAGVSAAFTAGYALGRALDNATGASDWLSDKMIELFDKDKSESSGDAENIPGPRDAGPAGGAPTTEDESCPPNQLTPSGPKREQDDEPKNDPPEDVPNKQDKFDNPPPKSVGTGMPNPDGADSGSGGPVASSDGGQLVMPNPDAPIPVGPGGAPVASSQQTNVAMDFDCGGPFPAPELNPIGPVTAVAFAASSELMPNPDAPDGGGIGPEVNPYAAQDLSTFAFASGNSAAAYEYGEFGL